MNNPDNKRLVKFLGGEPFEAIITRNVFGRLMIESSLRYRLAKIWEEILGSGNVEFYMKESADFCGKRFEEILASCSNDIFPCGVKKAANNARIHIIDYKIKAFDTSLARGSQVWLFNKIEKKDRVKNLKSVGFKESQLFNIKLKHEVGNPTMRQHLDKLPLETFDYTLILAEDSLDDSRALETLLLIRDIKVRTYGGAQNMINFYVHKKRD